MAVVILGTASVSVAQVPTLAEQVDASGGKPIIIPVLQDVAPLPIGELSARSDVIVDGTLVRLRSYVSDDGKDVFTDYQIVPSRVLASRTPEVRSTPDQLPPMILTVLGGEVIVSGTSVRMINSKMRPIRDQGRFLVFATLAKAGENRFEPTGDSAGMFEIVQGQRLEPLFKQASANEEVENVPLEEIVTRIQASTRRK